MRFPIVRKPVSWIEYANLSSALQESLFDAGIIDPITGEARQDYFELPIEGGSILSYLDSTFELTGEFHVGCSIDLRPPNFRFSATKGNRGEGAAFGYKRKLDFDVFQRENFFRKGYGMKPIRDLSALSAAYNQRGNYRESVFLEWWRDLSGKYYYSSVSLDFQGDFATLKCRIEDADGNYHQNLIDGTIIEEILNKSGDRPVQIGDYKETRRMLFFLSHTAAKVFTPMTQIRYPPQLELV